MVELEPMSPDIALFHILPRLPVKSVSRFKCVSKQWHSFITTPRFPKMHRHHQNNHKLIFLPNDRPWEFRTIDCETPKDGFTASRPFPFEIDLTQEVSIATSLHGMVCVLLTKLGYKDTDIILWNPVTDDYKMLSKDGSHNGCYESVGDEFQLYYISSEDDYKLVCLTEDHNQVYIYSLKSNSWRTVNRSTGRCSNAISYDLISSIFLNEKFDYLRELFEFKELTVPPSGNERTDFMGFMVVRGRIHFCVAIINSIGEYDTIELWKMDEDEYEEWAKVKTSSSKEKLSCAGKPKHLMRNGNWLMHNNTWEGYVYVLDTKKHTKHTMCSISIAFQPVGKYVETFVSPNQYMK